MSNQTPRRPFVCEGLESRTLLAEILSNTTTNGSINAVGERDAYQINVTAGERIVISLAQVDAAFDPYVALYAPDGTLVDEDVGVNAASLNVVAGATGVYDILVLDSGNDARGNYQLHYAKLPHTGPALNPADGDGKTLVSNTTTAGAIQTPGDFDLFSIEAFAGDTIVLSLAEVDSAYEPYLALYAPDGTLVAESTGVAAAFTISTAATGGVYNALVFDSGNDAAGSYRLHFVRLPHVANPVDPTDGHGRTLTTATTLSAAIDSPGDFDLYSIDAVAGQRLIVSVTEGDTAYDPYIALYDPSGRFVAQSSGATDANLDVAATASGIYNVLVFDAGDDGAGAYSLTYAPRATVVGRHVFYNDSFWDTTADPVNNPNPGDDSAIAPDKQALLPGQAASATNVSNYSKGINGVMIDVARLASAGGVAAANFVFRTGTAGDPANWSLAPDPQSIAVRPGAGVGGADRVVVTWADGAILNRWLQVTTLADAVTNLIGSDVFYFGNLVGETATSGAATVNASDLVLSRNAIGTGFATRTRTTDFNRDGVVNASDLVLCRNNVGRFLPAFSALRVNGDVLQGRFVASSARRFDDELILR